MCLNIVSYLTTYNQLATEQTPLGKVVNQAQKGGGWITWVFAPEYIPKAKEKFGRSAIEGHHTSPNRPDFIWKQIGVNEITDSCDHPYFIQCLPADHPSQVRKAVAAIEKFAVAYTNHPSYICFKMEIFGGLNSPDVEFIDSSANDGEYAIGAVHFLIPNGLIRI